MPYLSSSDILNKIFDGHSLNITEAFDGEPVSGQKTVGTAGTAETLSSDTIEHYVRIKALASNSGDVFIDGSDVSSANGYPLSAGEKIELPIRDLSNIYLDTATGGEGVKYIGI